MWPLIKLLPITTNFRFVAFSRIAAVISVIAVIGSLAMVLIPFQPPCGGLARVTQKAVRRHVRRGEAGAKFMGFSSG